MAESGIYVYVSHQPAGRYRSCACRRRPGELSRLQDIGRDRHRDAARREPRSALSVRGAAHRAVRGRELRDRRREWRRSPTSDTRLPRRAPLTYAPIAAAGSCSAPATRPKRARRTGLISVARDQSARVRACAASGHPHAPQGARESAGSRPTDFVLASSCDGGVMVRHAFDAQAGLFNSNPLPPVIVQPESGPRHFVFHPNNRFMYLLNEYDGVALYLWLRRAQRHTVRAADIQSGAAQFPEGAQRARGRPALHAGRKMAVRVRARFADARGLQRRRHDGSVDAGRSFSDGRTSRAVSTSIRSDAICSRPGCTRTVWRRKDRSETGALNKLAEYSTADGPNWIEFVRLP